MYGKLCERRMQEVKNVYNKGIGPNWAECGILQGEGLGWVKVRENFPEGAMTELKSEGCEVVR